MSLFQCSSQQRCHRVQTTTPERLHMVPYRAFTMQIKKAVAVRANPLPYQCLDVSMCTVWGNTLVGRLVLKSKLEMQEHLPNHQETQWNEAFLCDKKRTYSSLNEHDDCNQTP